MCIINKFFKTFELETDTTCAIDDNAQSVENDLCSAITPYTLLKLISLCSPINIKSKTVDGIIEEVLKACVYNSELVQNKEKVQSLFRERTPRMVS